MQLSLWNRGSIQQENPTESDATHKELYAQSSRYGDQNMSLTNNGIETLKKVIMKLTSILFFLLNFHVSVIKNFFVILVFI